MNNQKRQANKQTEIEEQVIQAGYPSNQILDQIKVSHFFILPNLQFQRKFILIADWISTAQ